MMKWALYNVFLVVSVIFLFLQILLVSRHPEFLTTLVTPGNLQNLQNRNRVDDQINQRSRDDWICSRFPRGTSAAMAWDQLRPQLLQALHHPRDSQGIHKNWTQDLFDLLSPHVLEYSIKGFPDRETSQSLIAKISQRLKSSSFSSPLKIVVFGGSVVEGTGCVRSPITRGKVDFESLQECAWPFRLEQALNFMINQWLVGKRKKQDWVQIHNLATGGTNSEAAIPILRYWLTPVLEKDGADVIVNAYCANDNLPPAFHATTNTTVDSFHLARILKRNIQFVQAGRDTNTRNGECEPLSHPKSHPMILYVNDYLGNQQESIVGENQLDQAIQWLTDVEPTMGYVSISHSVRRWVWADTSEDFFSAPWVDRKGRPTVNVHYGMAGHVTTTISLLYYFLRVILDYCDDSAFSRDNDENIPSSLHRHLEDHVQIEIPTKQWVQEHQPNIIRPNFTEWDWQQMQASPIVSALIPINCDNNALSFERKSPCVFAFWPPL